VTRLIGAVLLEQNDVWAFDAPDTSAWNPPRREAIIPALPPPLLHHVMGHDRLSGDFLTAAAQLKPPRFVSGYDALHQPRGERWRRIEGCKYRRYRD
jgi:hypothetical protein